MTVQYTLKAAAEIPVAPIRRIVTGVIEQETRARGDMGCNQFTHYSSSAITLVSQVIWPGKASSERQLFSLLNGATNHIQFDKADEILCALHLSHLWREDPELHEIYRSVDLRKLDFQKPTCPQVANRNVRKVWKVYEKHRTKTATAVELDLPLTLVGRLVDERLAA